MRIVTPAIGHNDNDPLMAAEASTRPELPYVARLFDMSLADSLGLLLLILTRERRSRRRRYRVSQQRQAVGAGVFIAMGTDGAGSAPEAGERAARRSIQNIGIYLHDRGGIPALAWAYHQVRAVDVVRAMELQRLWEGIETWKADLSSSTARKGWTSPPDVLLKAKAVLRVWL